MGDVADGRPVVFAFTFGSDWHQSLFQSSHSGLINIMFQRSNLRHARTARQALALFAEYDHPRAVFVADPAVLQPVNEVVSQRLVQYVSDGGTVIFGGVFGAEVDVERLNIFFARTWDLSWKAADLAGRGCGTWLVLNSHAAAVESGMRGILPSHHKCSRTALFLKQVERQDAWYLPTSSPSESTRSLLSTRQAPEPDDALITSPVIFAPFGNGKVGFVGDIDGEETTFTMILAMMRLW